MITYRHKLKLKYLIFTRTGTQKFCVPNIIIYYILVFPAWNRVVVLTTSLVPRVHQPLSKIRGAALFPPRPLLKYGENVETRKPRRALSQNSAIIERDIIPTWLPLCRKFDRVVLLLEGQTWPCGARAGVMFSGLVYSRTVLVWWMVNNRIQYLYINHSLIQGVINH